MRMRWLTELETEQHAPWLVGVAGAFVTWSFVPVRAVATAAATDLEPVVTTAALAIGFLGTFATLMYSMEGTFVIRELRDIDAYPVLLRYIFRSIYGWSFALVVSLLIGPLSPALVEPFTGEPWIRFVGALWAGSLVYGLMSAHRVLKIMYGLLRHKDRRRQRAEPSRERELP